MNKDYLYLLFVGSIVVLYIAVQALRPQPVDWTETWTRSDKIPYGTWILHEELEALFPGQTVKENRIPVIYSLGDQDPDRIPLQNWIFINNRIDIDEWEAGLLLEAVQHGHDLFISASDIGRGLAEMLQLRTGTVFPELRVFTGERADSTVLNFTNSAIRHTTGWDFEDIDGIRIYFEEVDTLNTTILGTFSDGRANYIRVKHGDGNIYLHTFPYAFSNYMMRDPEYADYAFRALSYLPVREVVWDEYYKAGRRQDRRSMRYVLGTPSLRSAWYLGIVAVALFMIFQSRRRQRIIPELKKPENSTIEFAKTIGSLYLERGTHKELAEKKIAFFMDYLRTNLDVDTTQPHEEMEQHVSERSGLSPDTIETLLNTIRSVQTKSSISPGGLKILTEQIDRFYQTSER